MPKEITIASNRKASYEYELVERLVAGISLMGTEVKSLRTGSVSFADAYCTIDHRGLLLRSLNIPIYKEGTIYNHEPMRVRTLLVTKLELKKLERKVKEKGFTIVPTRLFFGERGFAKVEIALARGKKSFDKRETIKKKDLQRQINRNEY